MKKLSFMLLALLTVTLFTACGNDDKPENRQTVSMVINNRAIDGEKQSKYEVQFNDLTVTPTATGYTITAAQAEASNKSYTITDLNVNLSSQCQIINDNAGPVICTSQLLYAYTTPSVNNPDNGNHNTHEHSAYLFVLDSKCEKCILRISEVQFNDLTVTPTATGYTITAAQAEASNKSYTITDLNVNLSSQCQVINGSFKCKDLDFAIMGKVFPNVNWAEPF